MNELTEMQKAYKEHVEKFGVEPVITGINFEQSDMIVEWIYDAIDRGEPYVEEEPKEGVII